MGDEVLEGAVAIVRVPTEPTIYAFQPRVLLGADEGQQLQDHGFDPETATPEEFYASTGEWPSTSTRVVVETQLLPAGWRRVIDDVRRARGSGWYPFSVRERKAMSKGLVRQLVANMRSGFAAYMEPAKVSGPWPTFFRGFIENYTDSLWSSANQGGS